MHNTHHHRRSIRLQGYDYTQNGAYFVTICAHARRCVFGQVMDGAMVINVWGQMAQSCWDEIPAHFPMVELDAFVVMPNHVHGIIVITHDDPIRATDTGTNDVPTTDTGVNNVGAQCIAPKRGAPHAGMDDVGATHGSPLPNGPKRNSLGAIIGQFKSSVTRHINRLPNPPDHPIWQRNYYEHIIRNEESLNTIRAYVAHNPTHWAQDKLFVAS